MVYKLHHSFLSLSSPLQQLCPWESYENFYKFGDYRCPSVSSVHTSKLQRDFLKKQESYTLDAEAPAKPGGFEHSEPILSF